LTPRGGFSLSATAKVLRLDRSDKRRKLLMLLPISHPWGELGAGERGGFQCRPKVSDVVDEQGQTPERRLFNCDISVRGLWVICFTF